MRSAFSIFAIALLATAGCDFDSELAPRVELDIVVDGNRVQAVTTDLGYDVEPTRCRAVIADVVFTTSGEMHAGLGAHLWDLVVPTAHAHPGHYAGGEVVGELPGRHVIDWRSDGHVVGVATMLEAHYEGANFSFARASVEDGVAVDDPIVGHTFDLAGTATLGEHTWTFEALVDQDEDREIVGAPLDLVIDASSDESLGLTLYTRDPLEGDTVFDGIDFAALDDDGDGHVVIAPDTEAYNRLRRNLQIHDNYWVTPR
jgi:hypothetical protein